MKPVRVKNYTGFSKVLVKQKIILGTLLHFTGQLLAGRLRLKYYFRVLRRLLFFLSSMKHNKYVKIGKYTKINLYVPGYPSKAFFTACKKMLEFDKQLPCVTALISVTSACRYNCPHCYQKFDKGKDMDISILVDVVNKLQEKGIAFFNIEGGEPFLVFDRLLKVCDAIDDRSEILINSTGDGMTYERLMKLKDRKNLLGIMFSLHAGTPEELNSFMHNENGWQNMVEGINLCHKVGIPVTFNTCLLKDAFYDGTFEKIMTSAKEFRGSILQLIKPKPAGGWLESSIEKFTEEDVRHLLNKVDSYNLKKENRDYTFISAMIREESSSMFGCTAGAIDRFYINAKGDLQPCEFLNVSFGNIQTDDFEEIYTQMRAVFKDHSSCLLCEKYAKDIFKLKEQHKLKSLPLTPDLSKEIYAHWERDGKAEFYEKLKEF